MKTEGGVGDVMVAYAQAAEQFFREQLDMELDYSEDSIEAIEQVLRHMQEQSLKDPKAKDATAVERMDNFAKMLGAYVGEVMRRNWGGHWKLASKAFPGEEVITLELPDGSDCWPQFKAGKRIFNGPEDNVLDYFHVLKARSAKPCH